MDRGSGNLYPIYILYKIVVLASEPVGGRSRATDLPCFFYILYEMSNKHFFIFSYFKQNVSFGYSTSKISDEVPRDDEATITTVLWTGQLEKVFKLSAEEDPFLRCAKYSVQLNLYSRDIPMRGQPPISGCFLRMVTYLACKETCKERILRYCTLNSHEMVIEMSPEHRFYFTLNIEFQRATIYKTICIYKTIYICKIIYKTTCIYKTNIRLNILACS